MPDIFRYDDYRRFLRDWLSERPNRSMEGLARRIGCAKSYVSMVCKGDRALPPGRAALWGHAMQLDDRQTEYWCLLVQEADGSAPDLQSDAHLRRRAAQEWEHAVSDRAHRTLFGSWRHQAVLELLRCPGGRSDAGWIAGMLRPEASPEEVDLILSDLLAAGVLTEEGGQIVPSELSQATLPMIDDDILAQLAAALHEDTLTRACEAARAPSDGHHLSTLTFALPRARLGALVERLRAMQIECAQSIAEQHPDQVYQLSVALVPCTARVQGPES